MICCVMPAAGGGSILLIVMAAVAAVEGMEWALARIWWIAGWSAAILALAVVIVARLMRWARARDERDAVAWERRRARLAVPAQVRAEPVTELPRAERPVIVHYHLHVAGGTAPARVTVIPGTAGDITEGNLTMTYKLYRDETACDSDDFGPPFGEYPTLALAMVAAGLPVSAWRTDKHCPDEIFTCKPDSIEVNWQILAPGAAAEFAALSKITPGQAAHNAWCAEDDWDQLDSEARDLWETAAQAATAVLNEK